MSDTVKIPDRRTPPPYDATKSVKKAGTGVLLTWLAIVGTVLAALMMEPRFVEMVQGVIGDNKTWGLVFAALQFTALFYRDKINHNKPKQVEVPRESFLRGPWTPEGEVPATARINRDSFMREEIEAAEKLHGKGRRTCPDPECKCVLPKRRPTRRATDAPLTPPTGDVQ